MRTRKPVLSLLGRIRERYADLRPSEQRVADVILNFPGQIASYSANELAEMAKTSNAAVSRFVHRIGLKNYEEMRRMSREGIDTGSPHFLLQHDLVGKRDHGTSFHLDAVITQLRRTFEGLADSDLEKVAEATNKAKRVWMIGFRHAYFIAAYLHWRLGHIRENVHLLPRGGSTMGELITDVGGGDMVIAVALRRRPQALSGLLETMRGSGASLAVIGDFSLTEDYIADWVFRCDTRTSTPIDNHVSVLAVAQLILDRILAGAGEAAARRFARIDELHEELGELGS